MAEEKTIEVKIVPEPLPMDEVSVILREIKDLESMISVLKQESMMTKDTDEINKIGAKIVLLIGNIDSKTDQMYQMVSKRDMVCLVCISKGIQRSATTRTDAKGYPLCVSHHEKMQKSKDKTNSQGFAQCGTCNSRYKIGEKHVCDSVRW